MLRRWARPGEQKVGRHHRFQRQADSLTDAHSASSIAGFYRAVPAQRDGVGGQRLRLEEAAVMGDCHGPVLAVQKARSLTCRVNSFCPASSAQLRLLNEIHCQFMKGRRLTARLSNSPCVPVSRLSTTLLINRPTCKVRHGPQIGPVSLLKDCHG